VPIGQGQQDIFQQIRAIARCPRIPIRVLEALPTNLTESMPIKRGIRAHRRISLPTYHHWSPLDIIPTHKQQFIAISQDRCLPGAIQKHTIVRPDPYSWTQTDGSRLKQTDLRSLERHRLVERNEMHYGRVFSLFLFPSGGSGYICPDQTPSYYCWHLTPMALFLTREEYIKTVKCLVAKLIFSVCSFDDITGLV